MSRLINSTLILVMLFRTPVIKLLDSLYVDLESKLWMHVTTLFHYDSFFIFNIQCHL